MFEFHAQKKIGILKQDGFKTIFIDFYIFFVLVKIFAINMFFLQCWPVLKPQITGVPLFPGVVTTKESITQSPMAPPAETKG
jgi:hypothetical protein